MIALVRGRSQDTLSGAIWNLEKLTPGQPIGHWTAFHLLFIGMLGLLFVGLIMHFAVGWWR